MDQSILAVPGSLRRGSYNRALLRAAARAAPAGMTVTTYDALASIPPLDEDVDQATGGGPDPVRRLRDQVARAAGLLIATPEYNWSIPGVLKNAIDWLSRPGPEEVLIGKPVALMGASAGRWGTRLAQAALRQILTSTESLVLPGPVLFVRDARQAFDANGELVDAAIREQLAGLLATFSEWIDLVAVPVATARTRRS